jgi:hypothetical protein
MNLRGGATCDGLMRTGILQHLPPECRLAGKAVHIEGRGDFVERWFHHAMPRVAGQIRPHGPREGPAGPRTPAALIAAGSVHSVGVVLEMHAGVAEKHIRRRVRDEPRQRRVGQRPRVQHRLVATQVGAERAVEAEDGARGKAARPQGVAVFEAGEVKIRAPIRGAERMQRALVEPDAGRGQVRARRQRRHLWQGEPGSGRAQARESSLGARRGFGDNGGVERIRTNASVRRTVRHRV